MASAVATETYGSRLFIKSYDHDPGATTAIVVSPDGGTTKRTIDMSGYHSLAVMAKPTVVAAGGLTKLEIIASAASDMSSPVVVKDSGTVAADALDDNVFLECTAEEIVKLGETLRYCAGRLTHATATDESSVTYIAEPRFAYSGISATVIT